MPRAIRDAVVVITGASSGIGRATALALARRGARGLALAARREQLPREVAGECEHLGTTVLAVPTDVTDEAAVRALADRALARLRR